MIFGDQSQLSIVPSSSKDRQERQTENLDDYFLSGDRERRTIRPPIRFARADCISNHSTISNFEDPSSFEEVLNSNEKNQWLADMRSKINSLHKNETWELVDKPLNKGIIPCKWVYKRKNTVENGEEV